MVSWSSSVLNSLVSPNFTAFKTASIPDISEQFPQAPHWVLNFFLNSALSEHYKPGAQQVVLGYLRRVHHAFAAYHDARTRTLSYLDGNDPHNPRLGQYYDAISAWEGFAVQVAMAIDLYDWFNEGNEAFKKNDGSKEQRLYSIANQVKHVGSCVDSGQCSEEDSLPLWLSNDGLVSFGTNVMFTEAAEILSDMSSVADLLQNPRSLRDQPLPSGSEPNVT